MNDKQNIIDFLKGYHHSTPATAKSVKFTQEACK